MIWDLRLFRVSAIMWCDGGYDCDDCDDCDDDGEDAMIRGHCKLSKL